MLNGAVLYLNAGIQGGRTMIRSFKERPAQTAAKVATAVYLPVAMAALYNVKDPKRKAVFDDISDFEKDNNIILVYGDERDKHGAYSQVIKIPLPQGVSNLAVPVRRGIESLAGLEPLKLKEVADNLIGAVSPIEPNFKSLVSSATPHAIKLPAQEVLNKDFFTGQDIVPSRLQKAPVKYQVKPDTSGTARGIGNLIGASPIKVEHFIKSASGGTGLNVLNASDQLLNLLGAIPPEQIGGVSVKDAVMSRFNRARGGQVRRRAEEKAKEQMNRSGLEEMLGL